jgi:glutathione synthase/RimK-type ligase-like ATP-grasp enzyme
MNKVLIIGSRHDQDGEEQNLAKYGTFFQEATSSDYKVFHALLDDLVFDISPEVFSIYDSANQNEFTEYKIIIMRGKLRDDIDAIFAVSEYAKLNALVCYNNYNGVRSISKLAQAVNFYLAGVPFPRTIYAAPTQLLGLIDKGRLNFPFIYKSRLGAHGINNYLIKTKEEFSKAGSWGMVAQPFIPNHGDYRVIIAGSNDLVIKRTAVSGSHLNNTSQGGRAELVKNFEKKFLDESHKIAKNAGMTIAGVDIIIDRNNSQHYFLEINSQPQLMSGAFLKEKKQLMKKLFEDLNQS